MQNIKYHAANIAAVTLFSFVCAITINSIVRFSLAPVQLNPSQYAPSGQSGQSQKTPVDYSAIVNSGFFKIAAPESVLGGSPAASADMADLVLMGTITGPDSIACAMIKKRSDPDAKIYSRNKGENNVFGYKLVKIEKLQVSLKIEDKIMTLLMYPPPGAPESSQAAPAASNSSDGAEKVKRNISRSDLQQRIKNNMDTLMQGLRAGPYLVNGKIDGFKLFLVKPDNFLYQLGARSGDVVKRINGHPIDSTEKLYKIWSTLPQESRITIDMERANKTVTFDYTFTE